MFLWDFFKYCNVRTKKLHRIKSEKKTPFFLKNGIINLNQTVRTQSIVGCSTRNTSPIDLYIMTLLTLLRQVQFLCPYEKVHSKKVQQKRCHLPIFFLYFMHSSQLDCLAQLRFGTNYHIHLYVMYFLFDMGINDHQSGL